MRCSFVSDLHLDATTPERNDAFRRFLACESVRCDELYLLGDLTEVWVGDDDDSPFVDSLARDLRAASAHCRVHLMHGNRDFLIGHAFATRSGVRLIGDPYVIERNGMRVLLCHGDALCTGDVEYQRLRSVLRSPEWQADVLSRPLPDRRALAATLRDRSRASNANKPDNIMDAVQNAIECAWREHEVDAIVHGHTHRPGIHASIDAAHRRYVLGDWDRCGWLLRFDGTFTLQRFGLAHRCGT